MCAATYLFEMDVSKTRPLWTPRQPGEWDSLLLEHLHHQHICLMWEACLLGCMIGCMRGCVRRFVVWERCVWVCERVWDGVSGVCDGEAQGTGAKSIHTHQPYQLHTFPPSWALRPPSRFTACDKKLTIKDKNACPTNSSNQGLFIDLPFLLIQDHCWKWHHTYPNIYM